MADVTVTPTGVAPQDEGFLNAGIANDATTITIAPIFKLNSSGVKTKQGLDSTNGFCEISQAGLKEIISFGTASVDATTKVTTLTDVRRGLAPDGTGGFAAGGFKKAWSKNARIAVVDSDRYVQNAAYTDVANTFTANQTLADDVNFYLGTGTEAYIVGKSDNKIYFKDGSNSESDLSAALASGNDEKVAVDSGATADYIGAASSDGVLRTGDGLSFTDGGNFVTLDVTKLKDATATELTIATGAITATLSAHTVDTESDAASDDLDTINGGADGDYLTIWANNDARTVVVKHGTGNILTADNADFSITTDDKAITLRYDGTNWKEVSRATSASNPITLSNAETSDSNSITSGQFNQTYDIPAGSLTAGDVITVTASVEGVGDINGDVGIRVAGTTVASLNNTSFLTKPCYITMSVTCRTAGASGVLEATATVINDAGQAVGNQNITSVDTTAAVTIDVSANKDSGSGTGFIMNQFIVHTSTT